MSAQDVFNSAQKHYNEVTEVLGKFGDMIAKATEGQFSTDIALLQFDCILQYMLLHEAVADGNISKVEQQFINLITDRGDILRVVEKKTGVSLAWDDLTGIDKDTGDKLLSAITPTYAELLLDFLNHIAKVDGYIKEIDLLELINDKVVAIFVDFANVDGTATDEERDAVVNAYVDLFINHYQKIAAEAEAE